MKLNFKKMNGLIPAVIQDSETMQVLMLGFMNEEAYKLTKKSLKVAFWSRTKNCLWEKGETSGNSLKVVSIKQDCDNDTILIMAKPKGPTCHKGTDSCFGKMESNALFLEKLSSLIKDRKKKMPKGSYTTSLFKKGMSEIMKKVGEESIEVLVAAQKETKKRLCEETADLLYHLLVLLAEKKVELIDVINVLEKRTK